MDPSYGSGSFGSWFKDEWGLPAYRYDCDQYQLPEQMPLVNPNSIWGDYRDHWNQIGNDRIVALAYNFGYVKIRQDEGSPKYLNDWYPKAKQYAGGFGYLEANGQVLSTFYQEQDGFERIFGEGYFTKRVAQGDLAVEQTIFAPYGDDPVLVSRVRVTNKGDKPVSARWFEYWGTEQYQMTYRPLNYQYYNEACDPNYFYYFRREFSRNFTRVFTDTSAGGKCDFRFDGYRYPEEDLERGIASIADVNALINPKVGETCGYEDLTPPALFVECLSGQDNCMRYSGSSFFANGDLLNPSGIADAADDGIQDALIAETSFAIAPGETAEIVYLVGYLPATFSREELIARYEGRANEVLDETMKTWATTQITIELPDDDEDAWLTRELAWHNYFLRSSVTYDAALGQHMLNQGCNYQYYVGNNVFVRDVAMHMMPFVYTDQKLARELIDYQLRMVDYTGMIFSGLTGNGVIMNDPRETSKLAPHFIRSNAAGSDIGQPREDGRPPLEQRYDDQELFPLWLVSEYVLATKDFSYLNEMRTGYFGLAGAPRTVLDILKSCFRYTRDVVGVGKHGLVRTLWNDFSRALFHKKGRPVPPEDAITASKIAESLYTSPLAVYCTGVFADLLHAIDDPMEEEVRAYCEDMRTAVDGVFNGRWVPRMWVNDRYGFIGDRDEFFMEGNCWTLVSKALTDAHMRTLIANMKELVMDPSPIGCAKQRVAPDYDEPVNDGWIWWALNGPMIWGLTQYDHELAYEEYKKNSLARHAEVYPDIWFGTWSADDNYTSFLNEYPGYTRFRAGVLENKRAYLSGKDYVDQGDAINFPVCNMHPHCWPIYDTVRFLQPIYTREGLELTPSLPKDTFRFSSKLLGYEQTPEAIGGHYRPLTSGTYTITIDTANINHKPTSVFVNGELVEATFDGTRITFAGEANDTLTWELR